MNGASLCRFSPASVSSLFLMQTFKTGCPDRTACSGLQACVHVYQNVIYKKPILILGTVKKSPFWIAIVCHQMEHNEMVGEADKPYLDNGVRSRLRSSPGCHKLPSPKSSHQRNILSTGVAKIRNLLKPQTKTFATGDKKQWRGGHWLKQWRCNPKLRVRLSSN